MDYGKGHESRPHRHLHRQQHERNPHTNPQALDRNVNAASNSPLRERPRRRHRPDLLEMLPKDDEPNDYVQSWLSNLEEEKSRSQRLEDASIAHGELS